MIGMIFSMCSMTVAGLLEMYRLQVYWKNGTQHIYWQTVGMHDGESNIFEDTNNLMQNQFCMFVGIYTEIIACYNNNNSWNDSCFMWLATWNEGDAYGL